jgi:hydrogenase-4 component F
LNASAALMCSVYAVGYLREDERSGALDGEEGSHGADVKLRMYYSLTPLLVFSMLLVTLANNLGVMWAAIELTTLASVFLVTFYGNVRSLEAAWKYAMIGGVGLSMALFGTVLTYYAGHKLPGSDGLAGLNWSNLVTQAALLDKTSMRMAFILVLLGYGTKAGLAPMHTWKPDAYSEAPVPSAGDSVGRHVELCDLRAGPVLRADQPVHGHGVSGKPAAHSSVSSPWGSRCLSCWCRRTSGACWRIPPSIRPA